MAETAVEMELINEEFQIETHGIEIIPENQRGGSPRRLFWIWLGGTFYVNGLVVGGLLPLLGLNLWQSLSCILLAAICTIGLGIFTVYGARYGTSTMVVGRATMGRRGQLLPTFLTWLGAVGWECVVSVVAALLITAAVTHQWPHANTTAVEAISFAVVLAGLLLWSLFGHATILKLQKPAVHPFGHPAAGPGAGPAHPWASRAHQLDRLLYPPQRGRPCGRAGCSLS